MGLVVDASSIISLALGDEDATYSEAVVDEIVARREALAPAIFWFEIRNVLVVNERRRRLTTAEADTFLASLGELPIELAPLPPELGVLHLARDNELSVYDAAYLDLALRSGYRLASLDRKLRSAAGDVGVEVFAGH